MKKIIGIVLFATTMCVAMDNNNVGQSVEKKSDPLEVITGVLVIHPHDIFYSPLVQKDIQKVIDLEMQAADPLVSVRAFKGQGYSRNLLYLPGLIEFPEVLPLSTLRGKKDGDQLTFILAKQKEKQIILTCNQKIQNQCGTFEGQLECCVRSFKNKPEINLFYEEDDKALIEQGIIVKTDTGYQHGKNGYKFD